MGLLFADGGTVQLRKQAGPFEITLFSTPSPLRVGRADLSVMVQRVSDHSPVLDANVKLHLRRRGGDNIIEVFAPARHENATNKLLYAANVNLISAGDWLAEVEVIEGGATADVAGQVMVLPASPPAVAYWPYFALVPLAIALFVFNRWLRRRREYLRPRR
ncbi:MAG: hypothetical protein JO033_02275 [Acidobacteriaceae bacterium]|nr:hypothetical protein [Acidobacteriaceae bacterium]MBV9502345.1 hypothetical protein [Acidobacteriaceae bacterium]